MSWKKWKTLSCLACVLSATVVGLVSFQMNFEHPIQVATDAHLIVAYRSADPKAAAEALDRYVAGVSSLEDKSFAVFFETPANNLENLEDQGKQLADSYRALAALPEGSLERSKGIEVHRQQLKSFPDLSLSLFFAHYPWIWATEGTLGIIALVIGIILLFECKDALRDRRYERERRKQTDRALRIAA